MGASPQPQSQHHFVYVLEGELGLVTDDGEEILKSGDCAEFKAGVENGHCLQNRSRIATPSLRVLRVRRRTDGSSRNSGAVCGAGGRSLQAARVSSLIIRSMCSKSGMSGYSFTIRTWQITGLRSPKLRESSAWITSGLRRTSCGKPWVRIAK